MTTIIIDPVTRIEGHLRIEAVLKADGKTIDNAYSSSTMARGIEVIMKGRDPRDAAHISQRICGVCTVVHGLTSVRAVEDALGVTVPENARTYPQPDDRRTVRPRSCDALLPSTCAGLG